MNNDNSVAKGDLTDSVRELKDDLTTAVRELKDYVDERTHDAETRLLRAFGDYQQAETTRL